MSVKGVYKVSATEVELRVQKINFKLSMVKSTYKGMMGKCVLKTKGIL